MNKVQLFMEKLHVSEEEAIEILQYDELISKGADPYPLNAEQKAVEKSVRQVARKVDAYGKTSKRERKVDATKKELISILADSLDDIADTVEIVNDEREILFHCHDRKFKIVLSAPRT